MAKGAREKIKLVSTANTGHFYTTDKNKRNMPGKMEIKKIRSCCTPARSLQRSKNQVIRLLIATLIKLKTQPCCWVFLRERAGTRGENASLEVRVRSKAEELETIRFACRIQRHLLLAPPLYRHSHLVDKVNIRGGWEGLLVND